MDPKWIEIVNQSEKYQNGNIENKVENTKLYKFT